MAIDRWEYELAPSSALHQWFDHDPARWEVFRRCYEGELREHSEEIDQLRALARHGPITLVFSARDEARNSAVVLRDLLLRVKRVRRPQEALPRRSFTSTLAVTVAPVAPFPVIGMAAGALPEARRLPHRQPRNTPNGLHHRSRENPRPAE